MQDVEPAELTAFVREHVGSIEALEVLAAMVENPERWWDAAGASEHLGVPRDRAREVYETLARRNLLDIRITDDVRYQFSPGNATPAGLAAATVREYRRNPVPFVRLLLMKSPRRAVDFADAFRIRR